MAVPFVPPPTSPLSTSVRHVVPPNLLAVDLLRASADYLSERNAFSVAPGYPVRYQSIIIKRDSACTRDKVNNPDPSELGDTSGVTCVRV